MRANQRQKLAQIKQVRAERLQAKREAARNAEIAELQGAFVHAKTLISEMSTAITKLADGIVVEVAPVDLTPIAEAIKNQPQPVIHVNPKFTATPEVKIETDIMARYKRIDSSVEADGEYHGFADQDGNWFIQRESEALNGDMQRSRFATGEGDYMQGWSKRKGLKYVPYYEAGIQ